MSITGIFDSMDRQLGKVFAPKSVSDTGTDPGCLYTALSGSPAPFRVNGIPADPIRVEGQQPSNFHVRAVPQGELEDAGCVPVRGDSIMIENGTIYDVVQVQDGVDTMIRLILEKAGEKPPIVINPDDLIDNLLAVLRSNNDLVSAMDGADPANIIPYYHDDAFSTNFEQRVQEQPKGSILVAWRGTRTGNYAKNEATKHDFAAILKMTGRASTLIVPFFNGICQVGFSVNGPYLNNLSFRKTTVHPRCIPPDSLQVVPQPIFISTGYGLYDTIPATFTLTEKGLDI